MNAVTIASLPGSLAPNPNIEIMQAWRAWYFLSREKCKGREGVERLRAWAYLKTQNREKSEGSWQLIHVSCYRGTCEYIKR